MSKYLVLAPNGKQITISNGYGHTTYEHMSYMYDDVTASLFPDVFIEEFKTITEPEIPVQINTEVTPELNSDFVDTPVVATVEPKKSKGKK